MSFQKCNFFRCAEILALSFLFFTGCHHKGPNLLIIQTDEHNFRTLGCYRNTLTPDQAFVWGDGIAVETPNIDWLADQGAICTSFYATTPVCSPSQEFIYDRLISSEYPAGHQ